MIASLPMYDWPETAAYNDILWQNLRAALLLNCPEVPECLNRSDLAEQWKHHELFLSQTCIYPLVTRLPSTTVVLGTPLYNCDFCNDGYYASAILVRQTDHRITLPDFIDSTLAFNSQDSQSGFNALKSFLVEQQLINTDKPVFFSNCVQTGSHRKSISAVASGAADICAIDPVSWALAQKFDSDAKKLRVLIPTDYAPALPLICSSATIPAAMRENQWREVLTRAFAAAIDQSATEHLLLNGLTYIPKDKYFQLPISNLDMIKI